MCIRITRNHFILQWVLLQDFLNVYEYYPKLITIIQSYKAVFCSIRLLVATTQAINLLGKQDLSIKTIHVRVLFGDEIPSYVGGNESIVEWQGETLKVLERHLSNFFVDVIPYLRKLAMLQFPKTVRQMPALTNHHCS